MRRSTAGLRCYVAFRGARRLTEGEQEGVAGVSARRKRRPGAVVVAGSEVGEEEGVLAQGGEEDEGEADRLRRVGRRVAGEKAK